MMKLLPLILALAMAQGVLSKCNADNCARAVTGTGDPLNPAITSRMADCSSFMMVTVTLATSTIATYHTVTQTSTLFTALKQRQVTVTPSSVPTYASACSGTARYSSACSCWGITAMTTSVPAPVTTTIVTVTATTSVTECTIKEGLGSATYEIGVTSQATGEDCRQHCLANPACLSWGYGSGTCGNYTAQTSVYFISASGSGFFFYDITCLDPYAAAKKIRRDAEAKALPGLEDIDCSDCAV